MHHKIEENDYWGAKQFYSHLAHASQAFHERQYYKYSMACMKYLSLLYKVKYSYEIAYKYIQLALGEAKRLANY